MSIMWFSVKLLIVMFSVEDKCAVKQENQRDEIQPVLTRSPVFLFLSLSSNTHATIKPGQLPSLKPSTLPSHSN